MLGSVNKALEQLEKNGFCPFLVAGFMANLGDYDKQHEFRRYIYCSDECALYDTLSARCSLGSWTPVSKDPAVDIKQEFKP